MEFDLNKIVLGKATLSDVDELLYIIHRCVKEVNSKDYEPWEIEKFIRESNREHINNSVLNRHFYLVKYNRATIAMGAVNRD